MEIATLWQALEAVVSTINLRNSTPDHSVNVAELSVGTASRLGLSIAEVERIRLGALLHDIGQASFPHDMVLHPERPLSEAEKSLIKDHPIEGGRLIDKYPSLRCVREMVLMHQEKMDGSGYPKGLRNGEIPFEVQIISVADFYEALRSPRLYLKRSGYPHETAIAQIIANRGRWWHEEIVDAFIQVSELWKH